MYAPESTSSDVERLRNGLAYAQQQLKQLILDADTSSEHRQTLTDVNQSLGNILENVAIPMLDELRRTQDELQLVIDHLPAAIIVYDEDGIILSANNTACEILSTPRSDLEGIDIKGFRAEEHVEELAQIDQAALETGEPIYSREFSDLLPDGTTRTLNMNWVPVLGNGDTPARIYSMAIDATEQRRSSEVLERSESQLRELNDQLSVSSSLSGVGFWQIDIADSDLLWSDEVFRIHDRDKTQGLPAIEEAIAYYHEDDRPMVAEVVQAAIEHGTPFEFNARIVRDNGEMRHVRSTSSLTFDDNGNVTKVLGAFQDTTDDRLREERLEALLDELSRSNEELSRFSYVCSHDMKEPVRTVEVMTEMLLDPEVSADDERRNELIARINKNMVRLRAIIDSLLAYSRVDAKIENVDIPLESVALDIVDSMQAHIDECHATVHVDTLPTVTGARVHFAQLFQNLISNALKYTNTTHPEVRLRSRTTDSHHIICVEDNGPGIPADDRGRAFELFGRLDSSIGIEGVGVGLAICERIVTQYGGTITCAESATLGGAAFEIHLPLNQARTRADT